MKVRLADLENLDYMQYANMFYDYRIATVWSAPEVLQHPKKIPSELTPAMDVYSFGFLLWELWHCQVPFDGNTQMALHYVVEENARPRLIQTAKDLENPTDDEIKVSNYEKDGQKASEAEAEEGGGTGETSRIPVDMTFCDNTIASIIRKCWAQDPADRPSPLQLCSML